MKTVFSPGGITMRFSASAFAISVALLMFAGDAVMFSGDAALAQTAAPAPMTRRALRQQDRDECSKQVTRYQADLFLECMTNREAARKAAAKKKAAEALAVKRQKAEQEFNATVKAHEDWNRKRLELIAQERAKRADCKKQAADQKLHLAKRLRFIEKCIAAK